MYLTPHLERLIWERKAQYDTWTVGTPAAGLEVGENETVIILGFDWFPFVDPEEAVIDDFNNFISRINKQITFSDKNKRYNFLARTSLDIGFDGANFFLLPDGDGHSFKCYLAFNENISVNIIHVPPPSSWAGFVYAPAPNESQQPKVPLGYGTTETPNVATLQRALLSGDHEFRAFPQRRPTMFGAPGFTSSKDFQVPTDIPDPYFGPNSVIWGGFTHPFLTVHYVRINKKLVDTFI